MPEEAESVAAIVRELVAGGVTWTIEAGETRALGLDDVLVVAPFNAHVAEIAAAAGGARRRGRIRSHLAT